MKEASNEEQALRRLRLLEEYLSLAETCSRCGAKITEGSHEDDHAISVVAIEWHGEIPALLRRLTVCDLCAAEMPEFQLPNPLSRHRGGDFRTGLPAEDLQILEAQRAEEEREEAGAKAQAAEALREKIKPLEAERRAAKSDAERRTIDKQIEKLTTETLARGGLIESGGRNEIYAPKLEMEAPDEDQAAPAASAADIRDSVRRFLQSPYAGELKPALRQTARLYASGHTEADIAQQLKFSQSTVSRQLQIIKNLARKRR